MINRARDLKGVDVVNSDNRHGGELAASTLLDSGAKRLAFINTRASSFSGIARGKAFFEHLVPAVAKTLHGW